jgi:hypothetical protein
MTSSLPVNIYVFPSIPVPTISVSGDTLFSSASIGNQWYYNGSPISGATDSLHIITTLGGNYHVVVSDTNGLCSAASSIFVGISETSPIGVSYTMFPNPNNGSGTLMLVSDDNSSLLIEVIDVVGKVVYTDKISPRVKQQMQTTIDLGNAAKGIYMLKLTNSKGSTSEKMVVY